ncbi:MAG: efflux RND transporter permease subunit [Planctomycetaceae bacterium]|nr:CusA/CzcA family heavy metal efflux RND transporter [Planctomycetota bacterium]NUN51200.1 efflux RND transporter permease subunit [Planctomycetaceae bacterium]
MLDRVITWSLRHRFLVVAGAAAFAVAGAAAFVHLEIDAFPDTTPVQVQINTVAPELAPEEVEQQITFPVEQAIGGLPRLEQVRSISKFGLSQVVVVFEDGTDVYFARQLIAERLSTVELPEGLPRPEMGPVATGLGEVFHYVVTGTGKDLTELRTIQDWVVKPGLRTVPGTAEINSWGGFEKQYQVRLDPAKLLKYGLTLEEVVTAVRANNLNVGGGSLSVAGTMQLVQGQGRTTDAAQIGRIVLASRDGVPVRVSDVAEIVVGHEIRRGAVTADGKGEAVLGLGFMLMGENSHEVTTRLKARLEEVKKALPPGTRAETVYDRTELVDHVIDTVRKNLFEGGLLVVAVLFAFLGNLRAGLIVAAAIPFSMLFAASGMLRAGIAGSLLSLGAIDFGLIVDSSVIMVENVVRRLAHGGAGDRATTIRDAALEVRRPTMFGELIIMIVYLPILTLEGVEGKMFRPMALTVVFALAGSLVLSLTLMPVLASLLLPKRIEEREPLLVRLASAVYAPFLRFALDNKATVLGGTLAVLLAAGIVARGLGSEFVPRLAEGAIVVNVVRLAGTDLEESVRYNTLMERALLATFPDEIEHVWSRIGTAEVATDPMGVELTDVFVSLKPRATWKRANTQAELVTLVQRELRDMPGQRIALTQPIEMRINEMISGVRSDVAVKLFGDDFEVLAAKGREIEGVLRTVSGCVDASTEQITGQPVLRVKVDQDQAARYGISAEEILRLVEALGGVPAGEVIEGQLRFPLTVRLPESWRTGPEAVASLLVATTEGERIPLSRLAKVEVSEGPSTITREWGRRRITIQCNVRGRDVGGFVAEAQRKIAERVKLPPGRYHLEWGGQFENLERARLRLAIIVPVALALVFGLLYLSLDSVRLALLVYTGVPLAVTGGVAALWAREMPFSISAAVGFIALSGVAVLNGLVMITFIRQMRLHGAGLREAVEQGSLVRLRPVLMTALVASLGFVPMALATGMGAEVQKPLATVVIGGIASSTLLTLFVLPVLYGWFEPRTRTEEERDDEELEARKVGSAGSRPGEAPQASV